MPDFHFNNKLYYNPVEFAMDRIGGTWKMPILWRLKEKTLRYKELKSSLPRISDKMLSSQLRELEVDGFISRKIFAEVPPRVEYSLTKRGLKSIKVIDHIRNYGISLMKEFGISDEKLKKQKKQL